MQIPVVQFSDLDAFVDELLAVGSGCVRVWPAMWRRPQSHVDEVFRGVVCQAVVDGAAGRCVVMISLALGTYQETYGRPFGPREEGRKRVLEARLEEALELVKALLVERLPAGIRIAPGMVHTGLKGSEIQAAFDKVFERVYVEVRGVGEKEVILAE